MYLGLLILNMSKVIMCEYCYNYTKQRYGDKAKLCYMDRDSLIVHVKSEDVYAVDLARNVEKRFDTSSFEVERPLAIGKTINEG